MPPPPVIHMEALVESHGTLSGAIGSLVQYRLTLAVKTGSPAVVGGSITLSVMDLAVLQSFPIGTVVAVKVGP